MCGIAGYMNVTDPEKRAALTFGLAVGIDKRGGDAAGYVTIPYGSATVRVGRALGQFSNASDRFLRSAAAHPIAMLHARFATHSNAHDVKCAHPFTVKREGKTVLYGTHNGVMSSAWESSGKYDRPLTVDSLELFELLADGKHDEINQQNGWGVISWIRADDRHTIRLCVLSDGGALYVARTDCGAIVYGSTGPIVENALALAGMKSSAHYKYETGVVYAVRMSDRGIAEFFATDEPRLKFAEEDTWDWRAYIKKHNTTTWISKYTDNETATYGEYLGKPHAKTEVQVYGLPEDRDEPTAVDVAWDRAAHADEGSDAGDEWDEKANADADDADDVLAGLTDEELEHAERDEWWRDTADGQQFDAAAFSEWCARENARTLQANFERNKARKGRKDQAAE